MCGMGEKKALLDRPSLYIRWQCRGPDAGEIFVMQASCIVEILHGAEENVQRWFKRCHTAGQVIVTTIRTPNRNTAFNNSGGDCWVNVWKGISKNAFLEVVDLEEKVALPRITGTRAATGLGSISQKNIVYLVTYRFRVGLKLVAARDMDAIYSDTSIGEKIELRVRQ